MLQDQHLSAEEQLEKRLKRYCTFYNFYYFWCCLNYINSLLILTLILVAE